MSVVCMFKELKGRKKARFWVQLWQICHSPRLFSPLACGYSAGILNVVVISDTLRRVWILPSTLFSGEKKQKGDIVYLKSTEFHDPCMSK